jgi:crotonobetainyl-CoA:carnitine CoA-transferase CaiB-like acyl-CoA transferase
MWRDFCLAIGQAEWAEDPRFSKADGRAQHRDLLIGLINDALGRRPAREWEAALEAGGVPCTLVNRIDQIVTDEQVQARDMIVEMDVPDLGPIRVAGLPLKLSETPGRLDRHPPHLGEHTRTLLGELGYPDGEIEALAARGAVGLPGREPVPVAS